MKRDSAVLALALVLGFRLVSAQETAKPGPDPRSIIGAPRGAPLAGSSLESRTKEVAALLRCPVCQGLSVADSPASMALKMKTEVKEMLAAGYDQDQILAYFESSYGEFVRLKPPLRGVNWLVWVAPLLGLVLGGAVVVWALRPPRRPPAAAEPVATGLPRADTLPDDPKLASYVLKARELAYGSSGHGRPKPEGS